VKIYRKIPVAAGLVLSQVAIAASVKSASRRRPKDMRINRKHECCVESDARQLRGC
jgi:hypothetical protein